jgi:hypothetical protein
MMVRASLYLLALALAAPVARAEPVYVIEQLVVSISSAPGADGDRVGQVKSGDKLELIERQGDEAHVRLGNGTEGWIKSSYVTSELPLHNRLADRTVEVDKLKQDVSRLESELTAARAATHSTPVIAPMAPTEPAAGSAATRTAEPGAPTSVHDADVFLRTPEEPSRPLWEWVLGTAVVMLLVGFALGWRTLDRRIRRKYGGLRIY